MPDFTVAGLPEMTQQLSRALLAAAELVGMPDPGLYEIDEIYERLHRDGHHAVMHDLLGKHNDFVAMSDEVRNGHLYFLDGLVTRWAYRTDG